MNTGWVKLHRSILQTSFYKNPNTTHLAVYLLLTSNHEEKTILFNGVKTTIKVGELITGRKVLAKETGLSEQEIRTSLHNLEKCDFLTIKSTNKYSTICILKYADYQIESTNTSTSNQPAINQQSTTNNKVKNEKNNNNIVPQTSKNSLTACTEEEIEAIAKELNSTTKYVSEVHTQIMDKIEDGVFQQKKYGKTVYYTLKNWIRTRMKEDIKNTTGGQRGRHISIIPVR